MCLVNIWSNGKGDTKLYYGVTVTGLYFTTLTSIYERVLAEESAFSVVQGVEAFERNLHPKKSE